MSINTANLVSTANGQAELGIINGTNAKLFADHREIYIELFFPYMAISNKTPATIESLTSVTETQVKAERCWANVDICQVQSYSLNDKLKRDFTIGGLFDVGTDINDAVTVILFARSRIVDTRSNGRKVRDGNRTAEDIVNVNYGYVPKIVPFAYTRILNSSGEYHEEGITVSKSRYGRARNRFYFNYIIDSALANNISVNDNIYPYSDGYLSKTAFELGLKRYEKALEDFTTKVNSRNVYYKNVKEVVEGKAAATHKFYLEENPYLTMGLFSVPNMKNNSNYNFRSWAEDEGHFIYPETYTYFRWQQTFTAVNFDSDSVDQEGYAINDAIGERGMKFSNVDIRKVIYEDASGNKTTKYMPVRVDCLFMIRSGLPLLNNLPFHSTYNIARVVVQIYDEETQTVINGGVELTSRSPYEVENLERLFVPQMPAIGGITIKRQEEDDRVTVPLMFECLKMTIDTTNSNVKLETAALIFSTKWDSSGDWTDVDIIEKVMAKMSGNSTFMFYIELVGDKWVPTDLQDASGELCYIMQPNSAAGYSFAVSQENNTYEDVLLPKNFSYENFQNLPTVSNREIPYFGMYIINDIPTRVFYGNTCDVVVDKNKSIPNVSTNSYNFRNMTKLLDVNDEEYRLVGDFRLHNARVLLGEKITTNENFRVYLPMRKMCLIIFSNNKTYRVTMDYGSLLGSYYGRFGTPTLEITNVAVQDVNDISSHESSNIQKEAMRLNFVRRISDGVNFTEEAGTVNLFFENGEWTRWTVSEQGTNFIFENRIPRWVAIKDINGDINVTQETVCP